jgi:hypothetical protein
LQEPVHIPSHTNMKYETALRKYSTRQTKMFCIRGGFNCSPSLLLSLVQISSAFASKNMSRCNGYCQSAFSKICVKTVLHVVYKRIWKFCKECEIFVKFSAIKSLICPCCHDTLREKRHTKTKYNKNSEAKHKWYLKHRESAIKDALSRYYVNKDKRKEQMKEYYLQHKI